MAVKFSDRYLRGFVREVDFDALGGAAEAALATLIGKSGAGSKFTGFVELPKSYDREEFARIKAVAKRIRGECDALIVVGIGGSYLGARAVIEALYGELYNEREGLKVYFLGQNLDGEYISKVLELCHRKETAAVMISKSGTTLEPAVAFRMVREFMVGKYGGEASSRIIAVTDGERGALKSLADKNGYETFTIPEDIGGRYSVLTPVGLFPIAAAGADIDDLMRGAADAMKSLLSGGVWDNPALKYAAARNYFYGRGLKVEVFSTFEGRLSYFCEWLKQLFGESEGKDGKGIYPSSMVFPRDLHSLGQFMQDGRRIMFETMLEVGIRPGDLAIPSDRDKADGTEYLDGKSLSAIVKSAIDGTVHAHWDGGVPVSLIGIPELSEYELGWLIYFFEISCAVSAYMLGVNPFDQPGVEGYKDNMYALLGRPGYEGRRAEIEDALK